MLCAVKERLTNHLEAEMFHTTLMQYLYSRFVVPLHKNKEYEESILSYWSVVFAWTYCYRYYILVCMYKQSMERKEGWGYFGTFGVYPCGRQLRRVYAPTAVEEPKIFL